MTGRRRAVVICLLLAGMLAPACWSADAPLPDSVRQTTNGPSVRGEVEKFIKEQVAKMVSDDPVATKDSRELLIAAVTQSVPGQPPPSAQFLDVFADVLNDALKEAASAKKPQVRLNVAVLVARVAEKANNAHLVPIAITLLQDENQGVVLWAIKAVKFLLPPVLSNPGMAKDGKLVAALVASAKKHAKSGPIILAAYEALLISDKGPNAVAAAAWKDAVPIVVTATIDIMQERVKSYAGGIPQWPGNEGKAIYLLTSSDIWFAKVDATTLQKLHVRTVQAMSDLVGVIAQRLENAGGDRSEVNAVLRTAAGGFKVIHPKLKDAPNIDKLYKASNTTSASVLIPPAEGVHAELVAVPEFKEVKAPSRLSDAPPPAAPATTGAVTPAP